MRNRQMGQDDDEDLRNILESLKQRQKARAAVVAPPFKAAAFDAAPFAARSESHLRPEPALRSTTPLQPESWQQPQSTAAAPPETPSHAHGPDSAQAPRAGAENSQDHQRILGMEAEIQQLKVLLQQQLQAQAQAQAPAQPQPQPVAAGAQPAPAQARLGRRLDSLGIGARVVRHLLSSIEQNLELDKAWRSSLARLSDAIPVIGEEFIERGGRVAFVGPTGVGKTTTIGKLAARYVLKYGSASLALVTTDTYRIAAHEQLRTFGRILDVPVRVVDENHSLDGTRTLARSSMASGARDSSWTGCSNIPGASRG
jgi:flagellar biosynthesis protein FlhF